MGTAERPPHHSDDMIQKCLGDDTNLISRFTPNTLNAPCDYLLVECSAEDDGGGGVRVVTVLAGIVGMVVAIIALLVVVTLLIVALWKMKKFR